MRRILREFIRTSLRPVERLALKGSENLLYPPIFIVSPPRSGSTLLYCLAVQKFHLSYFSNFAMMCPESPAVMTLLAASLGACAGGNSLENHFGETPGWNGPNQGYRVWNRWFPTDKDYVDPALLSPFSRRQARQTIKIIEQATRSPFINKWQRNATRVQAIQAIFPEAVFLHLQRDPIMTVQSILNARRKLLANDSEWFSAMPRSYVPDSRKNHLRQAAEQVALIEMDLEEDKKVVGRDKFFTLSYQELCHDSDMALETFSSWYAARTGIQLRCRRFLNIDLTEIKSIHMTGDEIQQIKCVFEELRFHN
jgi:hypothetical protein